MSMCKLPAGKVPPELLERVIYKYLGAKRHEVSVGPSYGLDGAVVEVGDKSLVASMDPITGALERIGWLAVHVNANDVATFGVEPVFFSSCLLLPENSGKDTVETICQQVDRSAKELNIAVIGGHSETTPNLSFPIIVGYCLGTAEKGHYVTAQGAKAGNKLILTKSAGMEGTAILATDRRTQLRAKIGHATLKSATAFFNHISIVKEALLSFQTGQVKAMHDPTEGGVAGGLHELADASNVGLKIYEEAIAVSYETREICEFYQIDPLQLIASGSLLIAAEGDVAHEVVQLLQQEKIDAAVIGEALPSSQKRLLVQKDGFETKLPKPRSDHLWLALQR